MTRPAADVRRRGAWLLGAGLVLYTAGFFAFPPVVLQISDETSYVRQAAALARGSMSVWELDPALLPEPG